MNRDDRVQCVQADALSFLQAQPDRSVHLTFCSPPYEGQRTYGIRFALKGQVWVDWLRPIIREACRVTDGLVCVNIAGPVRNRMYSPSVEWLVADLTRQDRLVCGPAPWCWHKGCATPGSGGNGLMDDQYQRRDWEPIYAFARRDRLRLKWTDGTAFGSPPKWAPGGEMSHEITSGKQVNQWGGTSTMGATRNRRGQREQGGRLSHKMTTRQPSGRKEAQSYTPPVIANPGNVIEVAWQASDVIAARVGGHHLGCPLAHDNEAPMPLAVAERFVRWYCPPGGVVCDPFVGSGTTAHAAFLHGRRFIGCDVRASQVELTLERVQFVTPDLFAAF